MRKRIFSGAQPTGQLHIGNYLGAIRNWVALQDEYESFYCIVNLHAVTLPQDPKILRQKTLDLARIYLASGVDPEKSTIFVQSDVSEHAELAWILSCIARMGELERMTQFKEKGTGNVKRAGVGLFTYPILMASDILLYQTDLVPVGKDQKQHLELTRDLAERFNRDFGDTFKIPDPYIPPVGAAIMSLKNPSKKMSKSDENINASIFLLDDADTVTRKIKKAVTDSGTEINFNHERPAINNLLTIYRLLATTQTQTGTSGIVRETMKSPEEWETYFEGKGYGDFKRELAEVIVDFLRPFQARVYDFDDSEVERILKNGAENAKAVARSTLNDVYKNMGIN